MQIYNRNENFHRDGDPCVSEGWGLRLNVSGEDVLLHEAERQNNDEYAPKFTNNSREGDAEDLKGQTSAAEGLKRLAGSVSSPDQ